MSWKLEEAGADAVTLRREDGLVLSAWVVAARETRADHQWTEWTFVVEDGETGARATQHGWEIVDDEHLWEVLDAFTYRFRPGADHPEPVETAESADEPDSDDGEADAPDEQPRVDEAESDTAPEPADGTDSNGDGGPVVESSLDETETDEDVVPVSDSETGSNRTEAESDDPSSVGTEPEADPGHGDDRGPSEERTSTIGDVIVDDLGLAPESESAGEDASGGDETHVGDRDLDAEEPVDEPEDRTVGVVIDRPDTATSGDESETSPTPDSPDANRSDEKEPADEANPTAEPPVDADEAEPLDWTTADHENAGVDVSTSATTTESDGARNDELANAEVDGTTAIDTAQTTRTDPRDPATAPELEGESASDLESTPDPTDEQAARDGEGGIDDETEPAVESETSDDTGGIDDASGDDTGPDDGGHTNETASPPESDGLETPGRTATGRRADTDGGTTARPAPNGTGGRVEGRPKSPTVTIREATPADADRLAEIYRSAYAENRTLGFPAKAESATTAMVSAWIDANGVIVASVGDTVVGGVRLEVTDPGRVKVSRLGVHEKWKGKKIGSRLLAAAEAAVEAGSAETIWLTTPPDHPYLPDMYRDRGYERAGEYPLEYRDYDEVVFEKRVTREDPDDE